MQKYSFHVFIFYFIFYLIIYCYFFFFFSQLHTLDEFKTLCTNKELFTDHHDAQIVALVNHLCASRTCRPSDLLFSDFANADYVNLFLFCIVCYCFPFMDICFVCPVLFNLFHKRAGLRRNLQLRFKMWLLS